MKGAKWIKIVTDIFEDEKIVLIESMPEGDAILVVWLKLLCLAGKQNNNGVFMLNEKIAYSEEMLATLLHKNKKVVKTAIETFKAFGMIEVVDGAITIPNWSKYQSIEQTENKKDYMREYMQKYREKQKDVNECKTLRKPLHKPLRKEGVSSLEIEEEYNTHTKNASVGAYACNNTNKLLSVFKEHTGLNDAVWVENFDYALVESEIKKSEKFLKGVSYFGFFVDNYEKVVSGFYRDFKEQKRTASHFENERQYSREELDSIITPVDEISI